jgi:hypothetical protein
VDGTEAMVRPKPANANSPISVVSDSLQTHSAPEVLVCSTFSLHCSAHSLEEDQHSIPEGSELEVSVVAAVSPLARRQTLQCLVQFSELLHLRDICVGQQTLVSALLGRLMSRGYVEGKLGGLRGREAGEGRESGDCGIMGVDLLNRE